MVVTLRLSKTKFRYPVPTLVELGFEEEQGIEEIREGSDYFEIEYFAYTGQPRIIVQEIDLLYDFVADLGYDVSLSLASGEPTVTIEAA